ncbi:FAD-dependent oxidoreductase [Dyadobacter tibetensis]|uniref:FAD-dependent oxidoreductase n=1 Tax=Dyadobacter tibetensis TaxID=1211851 RepID=UPI0004716562|nr:FAD-dependent oxidoreductase [Dyadobacter tibetensis]
MKKQRRDFIKSLGLGGGLMMLDPVTLYEAEKCPEPVEIDREVYKKKIMYTDLLVAGGGMAGICTAIAAARNGLKVVLVQNRSRLGGNASSEIRMHVSGASMLETVWRETGILEELMLTDSIENPQRSYEMWDFILYNKVYAEENITLLLDTSVWEAVVEENIIKKILATSSQTEELFEIYAKQFADCTGDGTLGALAGADFMRGREAKSLWGESLAVDKADLNTMGNSLLFTSQKHDKKMPYTPPSWARKYSTKDFLHRSVTNWEYGYWWLELGGLEDIVGDGRKIRHDLLATLFGVWDYIKNSGNHPESENWALSWIGMVPGKRESRRFIGDYVMKQKDIQMPQSFDDRVAYGGWPLDDHPPEGMNSTGIQPFRSIKVKKPYSIPLRSLYSKNISNLWMAGRNASVSHVALSSTRVMATCALMGQAIGTAAAYSLRNQVSPTQLGNEPKHIQPLQQLLLRQDQGILGVKNEDPGDLARKASVSASSSTSEGPASALLDGINRDIEDGKSHQWQAEMKDEGAWIELKWDKPIRINNIQITFDTGLKRYLRISPQDWVYQDQVRGPQPETVAEYRIELKNQGKAAGDITVKDNYYRLAKHNISPVQIDKLRLFIDKTHGDTLARVFEIRCYLD